MTQRKLMLPVLAVLAFAACQKPNDDSNIAIDNGVNTGEAGEADIQALPASETPGTASETATPAANGLAPAFMPTSIPAGFHGRWGINRADCTSKRGDAKGLLTINGSRLTFYESRGTPAEVLGATAISFDANYSFSGEGQTWKRVERFRLVGDRLERRTDAAPGQEPPVNLTYARCSQ